MANYLQMSPLYTNPGVDFQEQMKRFYEEYPEA